MSESNHDITSPKADDVPEGCGEYLKQYKDENFVARELHKIFQTSLDKADWIDVNTLELINDKTRKNNYSILKDSAKLVVGIFSNWRFSKYYWILAVGLNLLGVPFLLMVIISQQPYMVYFSNVCECFSATIIAIFLTSFSYLSTKYKIVFNISRYVIPFLLVLLPLYVQKNIYDSIASMLISFILTIVLIELPFRSVGRSLNGLVKRVRKICSKNIEEAVLVTGVYFGNAYKGYYSSSTDTVDAFGEAFIDTIKMLAKAKQGPVIAGQASVSELSTQAISGIRYDLRLRSEAGSERVLSFLNRMTNVVATGNIGEFPEYGIQIIDEEVKSNWIKRVPRLSLYFVPLIVLIIYNQFELLNDVFRYALALFSAYTIIIGVWNFFDSKLVDEIKSHLEIFSKLKDK